MVDLEHNCGYVTLAKLGQDWTLMDCTFGVPLFDAEANESILRAVQTAGLWKQESLDELAESSRQLCHKLLKFVAEYQVHLPSLFRPDSVRMCIRNNFF